LEQNAIVKIVFTKTAVRQIQAIVEYIAEESPQGARRVRARLQAITSLLVEQPRLGQPTDLEGVRRMLVSPYPYLIFYRVAGDAVIIMRVRHAARNPSGAPGKA
jgi:addiction module RelE/StbE family toxin